MWGLSIELSMFSSTISCEQLENLISLLQVIVSGKLRAQRAKSMKFKDGYMISSGQPVKDYIDSAVRHVLLRQVHAIMSPGFGWIVSCHILISSFYLLNPGWFSFSMVYRASLVSRSRSCSTGIPRASRAPQLHCLIWWLFTHPRKKKSMFPQCSQPILRFPQS